VLVLALVKRVEGNKGLCRELARDEASKKTSLTRLETLRGVCFYLFVIFCISFREIQKLDDPKSEKLEAPFHELLSFSLLWSSSL
jgi:hypothetical protein